MPRPRAPLGAGKTGETQGRGVGPCHRGVRQNKVISRHYKGEKSNLLNRALGGRRILQQSNRNSAALVLSTGYRALGAVGGESQPFRSRADSGRRRWSGRREVTALSSTKPGGLGGCQGPGEPTGPPSPQWRKFCFWEPGASVTRHSHVSARRGLRSKGKPTPALSGAGTAGRAGEEPHGKGPVHGRKSRRALNTAPELQRA